MLKKLRLLLCMVLCISSLQAIDLPIKKCAVALSVGYFFYKMGLMISYGYDSSKQMYHQNETKYELPDHPKEELDKLLNSEKAQKLIEKYNTSYYRMWGTLDRSTHPAFCILKELGLSQLSSAFIIPDNAILKNYIVKMPTNYRLKTAKAIESIIDCMQLKHVAIPRKYSYRLPNSDLNIVVCEKIPENIQIKRDFTKEEIRELLIVALLLNHRGIFFSDFKPENFIFTQDKVYIIDSESTTGEKFIFNEWPIHFWGQSKQNAFHFIERLKLRFNHPLADSLGEI